MSNRKKIVERYHYRSSSHPHSAKDSVIVTLECGHDKGYKGSKEPQSDYAYCFECKRISEQS